MFIMLRLFVRHYKTNSPFVRLYGFIRLLIFPTVWFNNSLSPFRGRIACFGCGYGVLETILAVLNPNLTVEASDLSMARIAIAKSATINIPNISFSVSDTCTGREKATHFLCIDLLHHLRLNEQEPFLAKLWDMLPTKGCLIIKDVDTKPYWKYCWSYIHDSLFVGPPINIRSSDFYKKFFYTRNAKINHLIPSDFKSPYSHYLLLIWKK